MIIANGIIEFDLSVAAGVDSYGYPIPAVESWGEAIDCQYILSHNLQARNNGEAISAKSYVVYVEQMHIPSEKVRLRDRNGVELGQYSIRSIEHLNAVCQTKLTL